MIKIVVNLFAGLDRYLENGKRKGNNIEVEEGVTVAELLDKLTVPGDEARLILVNGKHQGLDYQLQDGDELSLFPPIGGG